MKELQVQRVASSTFAEEFRESVGHSMRIFGDEVACLFHYHARQNFGVDVSRLPAGLEKFDDALRSLLGNGSLLFVKECSKRLQEVLGVRIDPIPVSLMELYRKISESYKQESWIVA